MVPLLVMAWRLPTSENPPSELVVAAAVGAVASEASPRVAPSVAGSLTAPRSSMYLLTSFGPSTEAGNV